MSETRESYNVTLLDEILSPGPKLDVLVTSITDVEGEPSTDPAAAMDAWEWLEEHNPWDADPDLFLGRYTDAWDNIIRQPAVLRYVGIEEIGPVAIGTTYPHAISLAVVKAGKLMETKWPVEAKHVA